MNEIDKENLELFRRLINIIGTRLSEYIANGKLSRKYKFKKWKIPKTWSFVLNEYRAITYCDAGHFLELAKMMMSHRAQWIKVRKEYILSRGLYDEDDFIVINDTLKLMLRSYECHT